MSKKAKSPKSNNVVSLPVRCLAEDCSQKPKRLSFCDEHFAWFKEGLLTRSGEKAKDFDKKHQSYQKRLLKKAA